MRGLARGFFVQQGKKPPQSWRIARVFNEVWTENTPPRRVRGDSKQALRACLISRRVWIGEWIFCPARQKSAGILTDGKERLCNDRIERSCTINSARPLDVAVAESLLLFARAKRRPRRRRGGKGKIRREPSPPRRGGKKRASTKKEESGAARRAAV